MSDFSGLEEMNDNCRKTLLEQWIEVFTVYTLIKVNFIVCY